MKRRGSEMDQFEEGREFGQVKEDSQEMGNLSRMDVIVRSLVRLVEPFVQLAAVGGGVYGL